MKKTIVILHGWGLSGSRYNELQKLLEQKNYSVYSPDMPGFGNEPLKNESMTIDDYVKFVVEFMRKKKIKKVYFIGHSFGGRVLAKLAVTHPEVVEKIVFTGSPLIRPKLSLKKRIVRKIIVKSQLFIHFAPKFLQSFIRYAIYRFIGEFDYYKATKLKETFKNIINENPPSSSYIHKINISTLVLWGENDSFATLENGKKIAETIPHAKLIVINNAGHGIPYTHPKEFARHSLRFFTR